MAYHLTLMHPPLDDPTVPYHSNAYLAGHLRHNGFHDVKIRDINIEFVNYCLEPGVVESFHSEVDRRLARLGMRSQLSYQEQEQFFRLSASLRRSAEELKKDVAIFRERERFLDFPAYVGAMTNINAYFALLGSLSYPGEIENFMLKTRGRYSPYNLRDLLSADLAGKVCHPFVRFFEERLRYDETLKNTDMFGISVVYDHQLFHAMHFARMLKRTWPNKRVVFGGTAISQLYKYLKDKSLIKSFFGLCDAIVIGEGETAICEIVAARGDFEGRQFRNTITYRRALDELHVPVVQYEDLTKLGSPLFDHSWDLYLSPERGINYSPTRGCYWNRCTFCDYGLNTDKPTSPWRERKVEQVVADLQLAKQQYGIRYVYLAVDVLAPAYMERLADAFVDSELDLRWSAEIRLEKVFRPDRCQKLKKSGAVCLSFGMESGNQRILDLIDKGTKVAYMGETMKNFADAGVAVQLMAFSGFPTETPEEEMETREFVRKHEPYWSAGGIGQFLLTGTSIIARNPERFGIKIIETKDADVARAITYAGLDGESMNGKASLTEEADASFDDSGVEFPAILGRPWAGGTDSLHSMVYYEVYGRNCFKVHTLDSLEPKAEQNERQIVDSRIELRGSLITSRIDLTRVFQNRQLLTDYLKELLQHPVEPTYFSFIDWERSVEPVRPEETEDTYWLISLQNAVRLGKLVYQLLHVAVTQNLRVGQILAGAPEAVKGRILEHLRDMEAQKLIAFVAPAGVAGIGNSSEPERRPAAPPMAGDTEKLVQVGALR